MEPANFVHSSAPKKNTKKSPSSKKVVVLNALEHTPSAHILDLTRPAARPHTVSANAWRPNVIHVFLAHPLTALARFFSRPHARHRSSTLIQTERSLMEYVRAPSRRSAPTPSPSRILSGSLTPTRHARVYMPHLRTAHIRRLFNTIRTYGTLLKTTCVSITFAVRSFCVRRLNRVLFVRTLLSSTHTSTRRIAYKATRQARASFASHQTILNTVWMRTAAAFVATALIFIIPVKVLSAYATLSDSRFTVQMQGANGFQSLQASGQALLALQDTQAIQNIQHALDFFNQANGELSHIGPFTKLFLRLSSPERYAQFQSGSHILRAGSLISQALLPLTSSLDTLKNPSTGTPTDRLRTFQQSIETALPLISLANTELRAVQVTALPASYQAQFNTAVSYLNDLETDMHTADPLLSVLYTLLGGITNKRYLVVFQNNTEMRATGGFIGSFALVDLSGGAITHFRFPSGGSYDLQGNLAINLEPPAPIKLLRTRWEFQDANWFPDFPSSAQKLAWFYEKSGGPTVDGVIAIDTNVLLDLLKITGPVTVGDTTITANNALAEIQQAVEVAYDRELNQPKQFLGSVIQTIINTLRDNPSLALPALSMAQNNLAERHIQLMSFDTSTQQSILSHDWGGAIKNTEGEDYLAIINSNIGGQKTDAVIEQKISIKTTIAEDGGVVDTVTITRAHHGAPGALFYGVPNIDYIRVLVPAGSTLVDTSGFTYPDDGSVKVNGMPYAADADMARLVTNQHIDEASGTVINSQSGKTAFGNWIITAPGETSIATISYRLPLNAFVDTEKTFTTALNSFMNVHNEHTIKYSLIVQKQAGMQDNTVSHTLVLPAPATAVWMTPGNWQSAPDNSFFTHMSSSGDIFNGFIGHVTLSP